MFNKRTGQSMLEYSILVVIILAAFLTMQVYMKRGISGRWQSAFDDIGDQYDPRKTNGLLRHSMNGSSSTIVSMINAGSLNGYYTMRDDTSQMTETKQGTVWVGN